MPCILITRLRTVLLWILSIGILCSQVHGMGGIGKNGLILRIDNDQRDLLRRDDSSSSSVSSNTAATINSASSTQSSASQPTPSTTLPRPFDSILGENFTQPSCPNFFTNSFINNSTFQSCVPFSLLLQNSKAFFQASMYEDTLVPLLDSSCSVDVSTCNTFMSQLAAEILSPSVCGNDYALENPLVVQAYRGLLSYTPMQQAACIKADPSGKSNGRSFPYCYVSAINSSSEADSEMYFLPLGEGLPVGSSVSCSSCTKDTMQIFAQAVTNASSPLSKDYAQAASIINNACGQGFVNSNVLNTGSTGSKTSTGEKTTISLYFIIAALLSNSVLWMS